MIIFDKMNTLKALVIAMESVAKDFCIETRQDINSKNIVHAIHDAGIDNVEVDEDKETIIYNNLNKKDIEEAIKRLAITMFFSRDEYAIVQYINKKGIMCVAQLGFTF